LTALAQAVGARADAAQTNVLRLNTPVGTHDYVALIVPSMDVVQGGLVDSRVQKAVFTLVGTTLAAGPVYGRMLIAPPEGYAVRVRRAQAYVVDAAAAASWVTPAVRTVTRLAVVANMPSPGRVEELDLFADPNAVNLGTVQGSALAPPDGGAGGSWMDEELASGVDRVTFSPPDGYILTRPAGAVLGPELPIAIGAQYTRTAAAVGENDTLVMHVTYTVCGHGAFPAL